MRRVAIAIIALVLLASSAAPALAAGKNPPKDPGPRQESPAAGRRTPPGNALGHEKAGQSGAPEAAPATSVPGAPAAPAKPGLGMGWQLARAEQAGPKGTRAFVLGGAIVAINPISGTVTIEVYAGNRWARDAFSSTFTVTLDSATRYLIGSPDGTAWGSVEDLEPEQNVMVKGWVSGTDWAVDWFKVALGLGSHPAGTGPEEEGAGS